MVFTLDLRFGDILVEFWKSGHCQQGDPEVSVLGTLCVIERLKKLISVGLGVITGFVAGEQRHQSVGYSDCKR